MRTTPSRVRVLIEAYLELDDKSSKVLQQPERLMGIAIEIRERIRAHTGAVHAVPEAAPEVLAGRRPPGYCMGYTGWTPGPPR